MFIELHKLNGTAITIDTSRIEYFCPDKNNKHTELSLHKHDYMLIVKEKYSQVKEVIANATRN